MLKFQCFVNFFQFKKNSDDSCNKFQKDRITVGVTVTNLEEAKDAIVNGAIYKSNTKKDAKVVKKSELKKSQNILLYL